MNVRDFILQFGIEALQGRTVLSTKGEPFKILLKEFHLEFHSLKNKDWGKYNMQNKTPQECMDNYHRSGIYRFYAINENGMCIDVNKHSIVEEK